VARALAGGLGYRIASLPGAPPEVHYPPLFPLLLAAVWRLVPAFPSNLVALKAVPLLAALGLVLLLPRYLVRIGVAPLAAGITALLTALAPLTLRYATAVVSELPFMLLLVATLLLVERAAEPDRPVGRAAIAGAVAGLAMLTRLVGVALVVGGALTLVRRGERRRAQAFALAAGLVLVPWLTWLVAQPDAGLALGYLGELEQRGLTGPRELLEHLAALPAITTLVTIPGLADVARPAPPAVAGLLYLLGVAALVLVLRGPAAIEVGLSLALAVAWPLFQPRYVVPFAPLLLGALLSKVVPAGAGPARRAAGGAVGLTLLALALAGQWTTLAQVRTSGLPALEQLPDSRVRWDDLNLALTWLRASTRPEDVLANVHDPLVSLYTGRRTIRAYPTLRHASTTQVSEILTRTRARYLIDFPAPGSASWAPARHAWRTWLRTHRQALTLVYSTTPGRIRIWRIDHTLSSPPRAVS